MTRMILASTSPYRRELLARLGLPFTTERPETEEWPNPGEAPRELARRLAADKAAAVSARHIDAWVIGADQVAELDGQPIGKAGNADAAIAQLLSMSGRAVDFHSGLCLRHGDGRGLEAMDTTTVHFRELGSDEVARYVAAERPWDCAGSFKCEGLGIALFDTIDSHDPTALVGLPLIATARLLRQAGFLVP